MATHIPSTGFLRLPQIMELFPISKSAWWQGCRNGLYPKPIKLGPRTTVWKAEEITALIERLSSSNRKGGSHE